MKQLFGRYWIGMVAIWALSAATITAMFLTGCSSVDGTKPDVAQVVTPARVETVTALGAFYGAKAAIAKGHRAELEMTRAALAKLNESEPKDWMAIVAALDAAGLTVLASDEGQLAIQAVAAIFSDNWGPERILDSTYARAVVRGALRGVTMALGGQATPAAGLKQLGVDPETQLKAEAYATRGKQSR